MTLIEESTEPSVSATTDRPARRPPSPWRPLLLRLHFYAGVFVAPFLVVAAVTGLMFAFSPQFDRVAYGDLLRVEANGNTPLSLDRQVQAARMAHPEGQIAQIEPGAGPDDATRVVLSLPELGEDARTVFVDPYTGEVLGTLRTWFGETPLMTWLDDLHRNLLMGDLGRHYSEIAASWLWVIALGGLVLWVQRLRRPGRDRRGWFRRAATADLRARGVRRTRGWHAATGVWLLVGLLFLSATGLTWSRYAGAHFSAALTSLRAGSPEIDATLPGATAVEPQAAAGGHEGHTMSSAGALPEGVGLDEVVRSAAAAGVDREIVVTPPADEASGWVVTEDDDTWPVHYDSVAVAPADGQVTETLRWADFPVLAQLSRMGVAGHMGYLFGFVNQLLLAAIAVGLLCVIVWGYRMWWQRRPTGSTLRAGSPPARGGWRRVPKWQLVPALLVTAAVGWAVPLLGLTLVAFLLADLLLHLVRRRRSPRQEMSREPELV